jgi:hypothetical protein
MTNAREDFSMTPSPSSQEEARELKAVCPKCGSDSWCISSIGAPLPAFHDERYLNRPTPDLGDVDELVEDARVRADYLTGYADTVAAAMYRGERPSGIWNLERAAVVLRKQADTIIALRAALDKKD